MIKQHSSASWRDFVIGNSAAMQEVCERVELIACKRCTILITGETGTGKDVIARAIHAASKRSTQAMVAINCAALPATLIEAELFGHAKGAFTGAHAQRMGRFEQADRGTIFLDEVGDLPLDSQAKLLRILQERQFERVGSSDTVQVDVRVIAATNVDLEEAARAKQFREDLYYRLNVVPIHMPPLRERKSDVRLLVQHFLAKAALAEDDEAKSISEAALDYLEQQHWPGNVRQLEHAVMMAYALSGTRLRLEVADFYKRVAPKPIAFPDKSAMLRVTREGVDLEATLQEVERSLVNQALTLTKGNKARAADLLNLKRTTLLARLKTLSFPNEEDSYSEEPFPIAC